MPKPRKPVAAEKRGWNWVISIHKSTQPDKVAVAYLTPSQLSDLADTIKDHAQDYGPNDAGPWDPMTEMLTEIGALEEEERDVTLTIVIPVKGANETRRLDIAEKLVLSKIPEATVDEVRDDYQW